ncbi:hypothetical protein OG921_11300 [Aldersonia sp. NBC_00410]|uniref:hypothetical protein n=1 Tax=Aldersonia sp. NBC_00410 TaxID=2975954 RepID=UPI00224EE079|nr:hypothetical protein [Aldersonia sp. NBC_00410]MCX5043751.1 hypothetical protein [Aldersonia sp. NBC_00410]
MSDSSRSGRRGEPVYFSDPSGLENVLDDLEQRVEDERADEDVPGHAGERDHQLPVDSGDEAPS